MRKIRFFMILVTFLLVTNLLAQTNHFPTSGNVGIGTLSPSRPLHINMGSSWTARFQSTSGYIDIGPANSTGAHIYTDRGLFYFNKDISLIANPSRIRAYQSNPFYINVGASDRIAVLSNGNVGIGTTNPGQRLEVNGNIRAHEIKLEISNWPDYVFDPSYELMDIDELAEFVKENRHLPGVPSEKEVLQDGLNLGEMNSLLLKKIEELTLYLLLQQKELEKLNQKIAGLNIQAP